jgi:hypothetical protein
MPPHAKGAAVVAQYTITRHSLRSLTGDYGRLKRSTKRQYSRLSAHYWQLSLGRRSIPCKPPTYMQPLPRTL